jgi:two-component sensor histidine kinase
VRERDALLKEVHHRVKNNLQVISSLLSMQIRSLGTGLDRDALVECQTRVRAIALVHEKLHPSRDQAQLPFSEYARGLAADIFQALHVSPAKVSLELDVEEVALAADKAIPCGLILNELLTNALKHAFPDGRAGTVRVEVAPLGGEGFDLVVRDDGVGLPEDLDVRRSSSLGLQLVQMLAQQLGAVLEVEVAGGTCVRLTVPGPK